MSHWMISSVNCQDDKSSVDDAAVLKQELVSVQKMMDDVTREKVFQDHVDSLLKISDFSLQGVTVTVYLTFF